MQTTADRVRDTLGDLANDYDADAIARSLDGWRWAALLRLEPMRVAEANDGRTYLHAANVTVDLEPYRRDGKRQ